MATSKMASSYTCTSCSYQILAKSTRCNTRSTTVIRSFSSTAKAQKLGPESPHYIEIPFPPQRTAVYKPYVKGQLPKPKIMSQKHTMSEDGQLQQTDPEFLAKVIPEPSQATTEHILSLKPTKNKDVEDARVVWKSKMSASRRKNLRIGLTQLVQQQTAVDNRREAIARRHRHEREIRLAAKAAPSILNTLPTITINPNQFKLPATNKGPTTGPKKQKPTKTKLTRYEAGQVKRFESRIAHLHDLYLHSTKFILTQDQLNEAINKEFDKEHDLVDQQFPPDLWAMVGASRSGTPAEASTFDVSTTVGQGPLNYVGAIMTGGKFKLESSDLPAAGDVYKKESFSLPSSGSNFSKPQTSAFGLRNYSTKTASSKSEKTYRDESID